MSEIKKRIEKLEQTSMHDGECPEWVKNLCNREWLEKKSKIDWDWEQKVNARSQEIEKAIGEPPEALTYEDYVVWHLNSYEKALIKVFGKRQGKRLWKSMIIESILKVNMENLEKQRRKA